MLCSTCGFYICVTVGTQLFIATVNGVQTDADERKQNRLCGRGAIYTAVLEFVLMLLSAANTITVFVEVREYIRLDVVIRKAVVHNIDCRQHIKNTIMQVFPFTFLAVRPCGIKENAENGRERTAHGGELAIPRAGDCVDGSCQKANYADRERNEEEPVFGKMKVSQKVSKKLAPQMAKK